MNESTSAAAVDWSFADQVFDLPDENSVRRYLADLFRNRKLSAVVRSLNGSVLEDVGASRDRSIAVSKNSISGSIEVSRMQHRAPPLSLCFCGHSKGGCDHILPNFLQLRQKTAPFAGFVT
ncbi:MAG: hypothetical protein GDA40_06740 [Rhodobacteraceae bacterium]|nr:hypothetical protein [Paracoccaceae bacterium]